MPVYVYKCLECENSYKSKIDSQVLEETIDGYESEVLFETSHSMNPEESELERALICPRCQSRNAEKTLYGQNLTTFIRGYGYLDKAGISRDRNIYTLENKDPYAQYRQSGEKEHIKDTLVKQGKVNKNTRYYGPKVSQDDVTKAVNNNK